MTPTHVLVIARDPKYGRGEMRGWRLALAAAVSLALGGCGGSTKTVTVTSNVGASSTQVAPTASATEFTRCLDLWNRSDNTWKVNVANLVSLVSEKNVFVSVRVAAAYPGKCLINVVAPSVNEADQYLEGGPAGSLFSVMRVDPNSVEPVWDAHAYPDGTLGPMGEP